MDVYEIIREIGSGSFGCILLTKSLETGDDVVLKKIQADKKQRNVESESNHLVWGENLDSLHEIEILSELDHPNVVSYGGFFREDNSVYIVMEYCSGGDLSCKIEEQKSTFPGQAFPESQIWLWFLQICLALDYVHGKHILHRDLKTTNVFITQEGTLKLGDFGIAKVLDGAEGLTRTQVGTPYYLSPEMIGNLPYDHKSDIWALGCLLYTLAALTHPFTATHMNSLLNKIIKASFAPLPQYFSNFIQCLITKMLKLDPNQRPSTSEILQMKTVRKLITVVIDFIPDTKTKEYINCYCIPEFKTKLQDRKRQAHSCKKCGKGKRIPLPSDNYISREEKVEPKNSKFENQVGNAGVEEGDKDVKTVIHCQNCGLVGNFLLLQHSASTRTTTPSSSQDDTTKNNFQQFIPSRESADIIRRELRTQLGDESFEFLYKSLIQEGKWLEIEDHFNADKDIYTKYRDLLIAECAPATTH